MPSFSEILSRLSAVGSTPAAFGVVVMAALFLIARDWRLAIGAVAGQYLFAVVLFAQILPPQVAGVKLMVGLMSCLILFLSAREASLPSPNGRGAGGEGLLDVRGTIMPTGLPFRLVAALIVGVAAWAMGGSPGRALPEVSTDVSRAVFALAGAGAIAVALTEAPLKIGLSLLILLTGFELFYHAVEPSLSIIALLAMAHFGLAVVMGYLTVVQARKAVSGGPAEVQAL